MTANPDLDPVPSSVKWTPEQMATLAANRRKSIESLIAKASPYLSLFENDEAVRAHRARQRDDGGGSAC